MLFSFIGSEQASTTMNEARGFQLCTAAVCPEVSAEIASLVTRLNLTHEPSQDRTMDVVASAELSFGQNSKRQLEKFVAMSDFLDAEGGESGIDEAPKTPRIKQEMGKHVVVKGCLKTTQRWKRGILKPKECQLKQTLAGTRVLDLTTTARLLAPHGASLYKTIDGRRSTRSISVDIHY